MSKEEKKVIGYLKALNKIEKECEIRQTAYNYFVKRIFLTLIPEDFGVFDKLLNLIDKKNKLINNLSKELTKYYDNTQEEIIDRFGKEE